MASKFALEKAAQAWCTKSTSHLFMNVELAEAFADIIDSVMVKPEINVSAMRNLTLRHASVLNELYDAAEALRMLTELKDIKERMEAKTATPAASSYYTNNKEHVWNMARAVFQKLTIAGITGPPEEYDDGKEFFNCPRHGLSEGTTCPRC